MFQIPWRFQVFQTSGHPESKLKIIYEHTMTETHRGPSNLRSKITKVQFSSFTQTQRRESFTVFQCFPAWICITHNNVNQPAI